MTSIPSELTIHLDETLATSTTGHGGAFSAFGTLPTPSMYSTHSTTTESCPPEIGASSVPGCRAYPGKCGSDQEVDFVEWFCPPTYIYPAPANEPQTPFTGPTITIGGAPTSPTALQTTPTAPVPSNAAPGGAGINPAAMWPRLLLAAYHAFGRR
jgi:hypothetical protein